MTMSNVRVTAVIVGFATALAWLLFAAVAPALAATPLLALLPWRDNVPKNATLALPALVYLLIPIAAWTLKDKRLVWLTPVAPFLGGLLFVVRFMVLAESTA
jgi:hypothetical protein